MSESPSAKGDQTASRNNRAARIKKGELNIVQMVHFFRTFWKIMRMKSVLEYCTVNPFHTVANLSIGDDIKSIIAVADGLDEYISKSQKCIAPGCPHDLIDMGCLFRVETITSKDPEYKERNTGLCPYCFYKMVKPDDFCNRIPVGFDYTAIEYAREEGDEVTYTDLNGEDRPLKDYLTKYDLKKFEHIEKQKKDWEKQLQERQAQERQAQEQQAQEQQEQEQENDNNFGDNNSNRSSDDSNRSSDDSSSSSDDSSSSDEQGGEGATSHRRGKDNRRYQGSVTEQGGEGATSTTPVPSHHGGKHIFLNQGTVTEQGGEGTTTPVQRRSPGKDIHRSQGSATDQLQRSIGKFKSTQQKDSSSSSDESSSDEQGGATTKVQSRLRGKRIALHQRSIEKSNGQEDSISRRNEQDDEAETSTSPLRGERLSFETEPRQASRQQNPLLEDVQQEQEEEGRNDLRLRAACLSENYRIGSFDDEDFAGLLDDLPRISIICSFCGNFDNDPDLTCHDCTNGFHAQCFEDFLGHKRTDIDGNKYCKDCLCCTKDQCLNDHGLFLGNEEQRVTCKDCNGFVHGKCIIQDCTCARCFGNQWIE